MQFDRMDKCRFENEQLHLSARTYERAGATAESAHTDPIHAYTGVNQRPSSSRIACSVQFNEHSDKTLKTSSGLIK